MSRSARGSKRQATLAEPHRWLVVIAYDVPSDRRRARIANAILGYGGRIQGSVYELWITQQQYERLWGVLGRLVKDEDLVRVYQLCTACNGRIRSYGMGNPEWTPGLIV